MSIRQKLSAFRLRALFPLFYRLDRLEHGQMLLGLRQQAIQQMLGQIEARQLAQLPSMELFDHEFQVFSQWGEDGIIQFLLRHVRVPEKTFVEFGVEDYMESNTRFLLVNNNWAGLVIDPSTENVQRIRQSNVYWRHNLKAVQAFVTAENINHLLAENGLSGEIGLLSIDIDGNDYWVWDAIDVVDPVIVTVEYNHRFGAKDAVTIPYDPGFDRGTAHPSKLYFGASLKALCLLAEKKGYAFVGCNRNGVNAFFVRRDRLPSSIRMVQPEEGFVAGQFGEIAGDPSESSRRSAADEAALLRGLDLPLVHIADD